MHLQHSKISQETILKVAKEITVKFIETGRITPAGFDTSFRNIYQTIKTTLEQERENNDNA